MRVGPEHSDELVATTKASVAVMGGRPRAGWIRVAAEDVGTRPWFPVAAGEGIILSLP